MEHIDTDLIELAEALRDPQVWQPQRLIPTPKPERIAALATFKKRLEDEDAEASSLLDEALKGPAAWWTNSLRKSGVRTAGIVRQLLVRMRGVS
ncbi:MAG TPA: hypothetical protein VGJ88_01245, partial [Thermoanaerobaculia bacterium]